MPIMNQHSLNLSDPNQKSYTWTVPSSAPFDELIISWNALRPIRGHYVILSSVLYGQWSPWLLYAVWGSDHQYSFHETQGPVHSFQDQVELLDGRQANGFRIRVEACGGSSLSDFLSLFACTTLIKTPKIICPLPACSIELPVVGISQLILQHPRSTSFCSPTSATSVIRTQKSNTCPLAFAQNVYDSGFDIYGNWPFNTAQLFVELGLSWRCYVARLENFGSLFDFLKGGFPVIVSVKGKLTGSLKSYTSGHLIVVRGYDATQQKVLCMDPAYLTDEETVTSYSLDEFTAGWENRDNLAYIIDKMD